MKTVRPNIFTYFDPVQFLNDWFEFLRKTNGQINLNHVAKKSGLSISNVSMILNKQRPLTEKSLQKMTPLLKLNSQEKEYLNHLRIIDQSEDQMVRIDSLRSLIKLAKNNNGSTHDLNIFEYLTAWYKVAIFELVNLADFELEAGWIQKRLIKKIPLIEITEAIEFLKDHKFIGLNENKKWVQLKKDMNCQGGIYRLSLSEFHRQIFELAHASIESVARDDRMIMGQTMALSAQDFENLKKIINEAVLKMNEVNKNDSEKKSVYHIEIAAFPLILKKLKAKAEDEK